MLLSCAIRTLIRKRPLAISRGVSASSDNLFVRVEHEGCEGIGEMAPYAIGPDAVQTAEESKSELERIAPRLEGLSPAALQRIESFCSEWDIGPGARAALDFACHDWLGRQLGWPVWRVLGTDPDRIPPTSLTIGIGSPEESAERVREWQSAYGGRLLKLKLGSQKGLEKDRAMLLAVREAMTTGTVVRVDANGGWTPRAAGVMVRWLAEHGVEYVEQPLPRGQEEALPELFRLSPLPLFVDESCRVAEDVPKLADRVHGVNLKLMKAGGIRPGLRLIHACRAHGLKVMMGCMGEGQLAIAGSLQIAAYADYLDLDSHLNQANDPHTGLKWEDGRVLPTAQPGLGVSPAEGRE